MSFLIYPSSVSSYFSVPHQSIPVIRSKCIPIYPHLFFVIPAIIFLLSNHFPNFVYSDDFHYSNCNSTVECGGLGKIEYPFWVNGAQPDYCGHPRFKLDCLPGDFPTIQIMHRNYLVIDIDNGTQILKMAAFYGLFCPEFNITMDSDLFSYTPDVEIATVFYDCSSSDPRPGSYNFSCMINYFPNDAYLVTNPSATSEFASECNVSALVPVVVPKSAGGVEEILKKGFKVKWRVNKTECDDCVGSGGRCGYNTTLDQPCCFCPDKPYQHKCLKPRSKSGSPMRKVLMAIAIAGGGVLLSCYLIMRCYCMRNFSEHKLASDDDKNIEAFVKNYGSLAPKRYSYLDVKKMTDSFKDKLGQGGFGSVYRGKLPDGRLVAVKLLKISKEKGEEFINEVSSISRTSHVNIVSLLGFCYESGKRALIYEFMCNGSLEKFIHDEDPSRSCRHLAWENLYQIAIGVARGLEYLHCRCNTRILHFDVKPHNILLDEDFCPKISDFGLAKLCHRKDGVISLWDARGTMGYVAPEMFNRNFGEVSSKSDVYSYGMMILEMVGGRKNINAAASHTSKIYFPHWVYKRLELAEDHLGLQGIVSQEENETAKKMILVGLWCIQTDPSHRPSMSKVIDMLEESIEALQIPPKPFLSSPPRSPADSSTAAPMDNILLE